MTVTVFALTRVYGTSKFVIVGMRDVHVRYTKKTIDNINYTARGNFLYNRRFVCSEELHKLERTIAGKKTLDSPTPAERDALQLITETIKLCADIMRRYDLERGSVYFSWIKTKGSKEEEYGETVDYVCNK